MTRIAIVAIVLGTMAYNRAHASPLVNTPSPCMPASGYADDLRSYVITLTTSTDSVDQVLRTSANLPAMADTSQIAFVEDSVVCAAAATAHAQAAHVAGPVLPVYVLRIGQDRYIVFNGQQTGEYLTYYVFDNQFNFLTAFVT